MNFKSLIAEHEPIFYFTPFVALKFYTEDTPIGYLEIGFMFWSLMIFFSPHTIEVEIEE